MSPHRDEKYARLTKLDSANVWVVASDVVSVFVRAGAVVVLFRNGEELTFACDAAGDLAAKFVASINEAP